MSNSLIDSLSAAIDKTKLATAASRSSKEEKTGGISFVYRKALSTLDVYKYAGMVAYFDGRSYVTMEREAFENIVFCSMEDNGISEGTLEKSFASMMKVVWRGLEGRELIPTKRKLCFLNCVLDIDTKKTSPFSPKHQVINRINYNYDPNATCEKWKKFLNEVLPDELVRNSMQEYFGLMFVDRHKYKIEKMMIALGTGSNGKSVVFETISALIGADNISNFEIGDLAKGNSDSKYSIATMNGKLINYCSELSKTEFQGARFKGLVSGEPMECRLPYKPPFTAMNIPLMIANANELPATSDHTKGFFRRFFIIPFNVVIPDEKQNQHLHTELREELSGILNWVLEGNERILKNGCKISEPESVKNKIRDYEVNSNSILTFLKESPYRAIPAYKQHRREEISSGDLYKEYREFCYSSGNIAFSQVKFGEKMAEKGFEKARKSQGVTYMFYRVPSQEEYSSLLASGKITWTRAEFNYYCGYTVSVVEMPEVEEPIQMEMQYSDEIP